MLSSLQYPPYVPVPPTQSEETACPNWYAHMVAVNSNPCF
jgi:hypothetical protein